MRKLLLLVSVLLAASCSKPQSPYRTDATIKDIMDSVVDPNADYIWDSVATISNAQGVTEKRPRTDEEWKEVRRHAITLMEATNLIQMPERHLAKPGEKADDPRVELSPEAIQSLINSDREAWAKNANGLYDAVLVALKAIDAKNADALLDAGDAIDQACEACHLKYWYPKQYELDQKQRPSASEKSSK